MLYLFNKIYLKPDTLFEKSKNSVIISSKSALLTQYPELDDVNKIDFGTVHFNATSYTELLEKNFENDENKFFEWLLAFDPQTRLIVFCDAETLAHLTFKWYKTVLINMDSTEAINLISLVFKRYAYQFGYSYMPFVRLTTEQAAHFKSVGSSMLDPQTIADKWSQTLPFDTNVAQLASIVGIEFQLATYLTNNNWEHTAELESKIVMMVKKYTIRRIIDMKQDLLSRLVELPNFDILTTTLVEYVTDHTEYIFLLDNKFLPDQYEYVFSTYNMNELMDLFYDETGLDQLDRDYFENVAHWGNSHVTLQHIVALELSRPFTTFYLGQWEYNLVINTYLLGYILNLARINDVTLQKYSLEATT